MRFIPIVDPGVPVAILNPWYSAYNEGLEQDLFIKDITGEPYIGQVWPGPVHFPDFMHPAAQDYWTRQLTKFHDMAPFDGLWIDMDECSNFCGNSEQVCSNATVISGECPLEGHTNVDCCLECSVVDENNTYDFPPYYMRSFKGPISRHTIPVSCRQYGDIPVYNTHNLYGLTESIATKNALIAIKGNEKRPFVLTRSSFVSAGAHVNKWTGDNGKEQRRRYNSHHCAFIYYTVYSGICFLTCIILLTVVIANTVAIAATWQDLKSSVVSMFDFGLFGIPMVGSDICGFEFETTEELCTRWIQVGAFYPFSRSHNALGFAPQELYRWESVTTAAIDVLNIRYRLLPLLYTLFYTAHTAGTTVVNPFWYNFPSDRDSYELTTYQFMWGSAVLFTPVVERGAVSTTGYFPTGLWYNLASMELQFDTLTAADITEKMFTLDTPLLSTNIHILGGNIIPTQDSGMTTAVSRASNFSLLTALDGSNKATGSMYWDNGDQLELKNYIQSAFDCSIKSDGSGAGSFQITVNHDSFSSSESEPADVSPLFLRELVIVGKEIFTNADISTIYMDGIAVISGVDVATYILFDTLHNRITVKLTDVLAVPLSSSVMLSWD